MKRCDSSVDMADVETQGTVAAECVPRIASLGTWQDPKMDTEIRRIAMSRIRRVIERGIGKRPKDNNRECKVAVALEKICYLNAKSREEFTDGNKFTILMHRIAAERAKRRRTRAEPASKKCTDSFYSTTTNRNDHTTSDGSPLDEDNEYHQMNLHHREMPSSQHNQGPNLFIKKERYQVNEEKAHSESHANIPIVDYEASSMIDYGLQRHHSSPDIFEPIGYEDTAPLSMPRLQPGVQQYTQPDTFDEIDYINLMESDSFHDLSKALLQNSKPGLNHSFETFQNLPRNRSQSDLQVYAAPSHRDDNFMIPPERSPRRRATTYSIFHPESDYNTGWA